MSVGRVKGDTEEVGEVAIKSFRSCENVAQLAREIGIPRQTLYRWIDESERVETDEDGQSVRVALHCQRTRRVDWHGSLRRCAFSWPSTAGTETRGATHTGAVCEAVRENEQERLHRCRGDRGGSHTANDALRPRQHSCPSHSPPPPPPTPAP